MSDNFYTAERLLAYIQPRKPETTIQRKAFLDAVQAQIEYDQANGLNTLPGNVTQITNDGVSMTFARDGSNGSGYTRETISPAAWAILRNAGLIAYALPTAKRP